MYPRVPIEERLLEEKRHHTGTCPFQKLYPDVMRC
jgi:hypothetical protein